MTEAQLQAQIWRIAWNEYPKSRRHLWAIPNGARRTRYEATISKATGTLAGVWDIHGFYKGVFYIFELKVGSNKLSAAQIEWGAQMSTHGAVCIEVRDVDTWVHYMSKIFS